MEVICPSRKHCGAGRGRPPAHSCARLFPVAGFLLSASTLEGYSEVFQTLSLTLLSLDWGGGLWSGLEQHHHRFLEAFALFLLTSV